MQGQTTHLLPKEHAPLAEGTRTACRRNTLFRVMELEMLKISIFKFREFLPFLHWYIPQVCSSHSLVSKY